MRITLCILAAMLATGPARSQPAPDLILSGGKIVTVNEFFAIEQAVAIRGERIVAVGSDAEINALAGPSTRIVDLAGKTIIPGLIDNHNHVIRATEYWPNEARLDGITTRSGALERLAEKRPAGILDEPNRGVDGIGML